MHIVAATPLYAPHSRVGAWLSTHECLAEMVRRGHSVEVTTALADATYTLDGVEVVGRVKLRPLVRRADVVLSHLGDTGEAARAAVNAGVPSVRMVHGGDPDNAAKLELSPTALAVFSSNATAEVSGWTGRKVVVHPPVDLDEHRTTPGDRVTLINLSPEKGGELFGLLPLSMPDVGFLGVRGGYGRQRLRHTAANLEVIPTTENMRDDVWSRTRVLLMPSQAETWGRVGCEAMASGIPVIAHPASGLVESLGAAGIFVDRSDLAGWISEIRRLQDPDEWAAASEQALARAAGFDRHADLSRFADAIEQLVGVPV